MSGAAALLIAAALMAGPVAAAGDDAGILFTNRPDGSATASHGGAAPSGLGGNRRTRGR